MSNNTNPCPAITVKGHQCSANATHEVELYVHNNVAYSQIPSRMVGAGWVRGTAFLCGSHKNVVMNHNRPLNIVVPEGRVLGGVPVNTNVLKEDEMNNIPTYTPEQVQLHFDHFEVTGHDPTECGCSVSDMEYSRDYKKNSVPGFEGVIPEEAIAKKETKVFCGKCKGHHSSIDEVKACYKGAKKGIKCGSCHNYHSSVNEVKACYDAARTGC